MNDTITNPRGGFRGWYLVETGKGSEDFTGKGDSIVIQGIKRYSSCIQSENSESSNHITSLNEFIAIIMAYA